MSPRLRCRLNCPNSFSVTSSLCIGLRATITTPSGLATPDWCSGARLLLSCEAGFSSCVGASCTFSTRLFRVPLEKRKKCNWEDRGGGMDYDSCRSLPAMFFAQAERLGDNPFLWAKRDGHYRSINWAAAARDVRRVALGLRSLGIRRGERVGLVAENRPEWIIADLAIMSAGAITVPAYVTHTIEDYRHVFANSGARAVIVSKPALSARVLAAANQIGTAHTVIAIEPTMGQASTVDLLSWNEMLERGAAQADDTADLVAAIEPDDIACLIYTSGTGGTPKGVMTSHRNILANCR